MIKEYLMLKASILLCIALLIAGCESFSSNNKIVKNAQELKNAIYTAQAGDEIIMANGIWKDKYDCIIFGTNCCENLDSIIAFII